jgi:hypothetical protein
MLQTYFHALHMSTGGLTGSWLLIVCPLRARTTRPVAFVATVTLAPERARDVCRPGGLARKNGGRFIRGIRDRGRRESVFVPGTSVSLVWNYPGPQAPVRVSARRTSFTRSGRTILFRSGTFSSYGWTRRPIIERPASIRFGARPPRPSCFWNKAPRAIKYQGDQIGRWQKAGAPEVLKPCTYGRNSGHWS